MFNFNFDTLAETNPVRTVTNIFGLPDPPAPHANELNLLPFSPPPYSSSLYFLPTTPERRERVPVISTQPSPLGLFHSTPQFVSTPANSVHPPSPHPPAVLVPAPSIAHSPNPLPEHTPSDPPSPLSPLAVPAPTRSIAPSPNPLPDRTPESPFASPTTNTSPLPYPFPTLGSALPTTHASRNPHLSIQEGRTHPSISTAHKATKQLQAKATREKRALLSEAIQDLQGKHEQEFEALARAHLVTTEYINKIIATPQFKTKRNISLENAKIHAKSIEVNADLGVGERIKLREIRQLVKDDPLLQDLSTEQEEILCQGVHKLREHKKLGARLTNNATAQVFRHGFKVITDQINSISSQTGACVLTIWSRGNLDDSYEPCWMVTDNASSFVPDVLGKSMWDVTRLLEQWACSKAGARNPDTLVSMRTECSTTITGTLKMVTQSKVADMNYDNYEEKVVQRLKVKLVGWPFENIVSPTKLYTIGELRTLRDALRSGACCWVRLSKPELKAHADGLSVRRKAGEVIGKTRKDRSDKGVKTGPRHKHGVHDESSNDEGSDSDITDVGRSPPAEPVLVATMSKKRKSASKDTTAGPSKRRKRASTGRDHEAGPSKKKKAPVKLRASKKSAKGQLPPSKAAIGTDTDETDELEE